MKRTVVTSIFALLLAGGAFAQAPAGRPEFEVGSIRQNKSGNTQVEGGVIPGGQISMRNVPLKMLLAFAYDEPNQMMTGFGFNARIQGFLDNFITGDPRWVASDRFDVVAKASSNVPDKTLALMLQVLLEKEFKMVIHQEQKPSNVYALVLGKGALKLQTSTGSGDWDCRRVAGGTDDPAAKDLAADEAGFVCSHMNMTDFAMLLPRLAPAYIDRVVVDSTDLKGAYDFRLVWVARNLVDQGGVDVFAAINKLGLKLEERKIPLPVVVIDHIEKLSD